MEQGKRPSEVLDKIGEGQRVVEMQQAGRHGRLVQVEDVEPSVLGRRGRVDGRVEEPDEEGYECEDARCDSYRFVLGSLSIR